MSDDEFELSRRKVLGGLGTVGIASAGAGLGTTAFFNDTESFSGNSVTAGALDLTVDWSTTYHGAGDVQTDSGTQDGSPTVFIDLSDVKPGDSGSWEFCFSIDDNPAYLWLNGSLESNAENDLEDPESDADLTDGPNKGELADAVEVDVSYTSGESVFSGTLESLLDQAQFGIPFDAAPATTGRACYPTSGGPCLVVEWEVPDSVGNRIQSDSATFDLGFYAEQCRHNDGTTNPTFDTTVTAGDSVQAAVDGASSGDVIGIDAGTFTEQVVVDKAVTLVGAGQGSTVIKSPSSLSSQFLQDGNGHYPVISLVSDAAAIWNLTVDGDRKGDSHNRFDGIAAYNAGVHIGNVEVTKITNDPLNGTQHGLGIYAYNTDGTARRTVIEDCNIHDYQKGGIVGEGVGLDFCVFDSVTAGIGPTSKIGQNGIQASEVAEAVIVGNQTIDNYFTPSSQSAGIIIYEAASAVIERNNISGNNNGIGALISGDIQASRNNITSNDIGALNLSSTSFDATDNWWGAPDGPSALSSGGETDPETGATASGSGDAVYDVHWDPFATSSFNI